MLQTNAKKIIGKGFAVVLTLAVVGYAYFRAKDFIEGPVIAISFPENGSMLASGVVNISGTSKNIAYLDLNGRKIFTDKNGNWGEKLLLPPGYNIIEAVAKDKFGREAKTTLQIVQKENETEIMNNE